MMTRHSTFHPYTRAYEQLSALTRQQASPVTEHTIRDRDSMRRALIQPETLKGSGLVEDLTAGMPQPTGHQWGRR